ncbi:enoyl-CoA delta isomerase 2, peroxisomal-like [Rutidosis leptorrhynchoides]|uniref:enoyl-CoA delta isomerase 2, peroxisomal-like n=1 Tax=Rutidosis leptorrhynchoides TaxID=125765 RepID=UPI003A9A3957
MCTLETHGNLFFLKLNGEDEHYLNPLVPSIRSALSDAKTKSTRGSVLITIAQGKFFSNGLLNPTSIESSLNADDTIQPMLNFKDIMAELISLPMPTIAVVTGHAVGGGLVFALCHDYVFMRRDRGVLYMSEIDLGICMSDFGFEVFISKMGGPNYRRDILLHGVKVKADEAVKMGLAYKAYDSRESVVNGAVRKGEELSNRKWDGEVYVEIRKSLHPDLCKALGLGGSKVVVKPRI